MMRRKYNGAKINTEVADLILLYQMVGERSKVVEAVPVRSSGELGSEHAGMSNDKRDENSLRRKPKVSYAMLVIVGLVWS